MTLVNGPNIDVVAEGTAGDAWTTELNQFLRMVQALTKGAVAGILSAPPGSPANGDRYLVGAAATGAFATHEDDLAMWTTNDPANPSGVWEFWTPQNGWTIFNNGTSKQYSFNGSWNVLVTAEADVTGLVADLAAKAALVHTHAEADVTTLVADLAAKQPATSGLTLSTLAKATDVVPLYRTGVGDFKISVPDLLTSPTRVDSDGPLGVVLASGDNILASPVAGFKKGGSVFVHNSTAGSITCHPQISLNGGTTWHRTGADIVVAAGANGTVTQVFNPAVFTGVTVGISCTASGLVAHGAYVVSPDTSSNGTALLNSFIVGNNTLLTCPAATKLFINNLNLHYSNESGGALAYAAHVVAPAGSPSTSNRIAYSASVANNAVLNVVCFITLTAGYSIVIVSASTGKQFAGVSYTAFEA